MMEDFTIFLRAGFRERLRKSGLPEQAFNVKLAGAKPGLEILTVIFPCFPADAQWPMPCPSSFIKINDEAW